MGLHRRCWDKVLDNSPDGAKLHEHLPAYQPIYLHPTYIYHFSGVSSINVQDTWPNGKAPAYNGGSTARHQFAIIESRGPPAQNM
jgi:hypothetical protein